MGKRELLSDAFISQKFCLSDLKSFFSEEAWPLVLACYQNKVELSTCPICKEICLDKSIQCSFCEKWYHWKCASQTKPLSYYQTSGKANKSCCRNHGLPCI